MIGMERSAVRRSGGSGCRWQMIVSSRDIANDIQGTQNVWVQGVGCGAAIVHFGA